jgi:predicted metal-dependent hydrolase
LAALFSPAFKKKHHRQKGTTTIFDEEFGEILVHRAHTHFLRVKIEPNGKVSATIPWYATLAALRGLINQSRANLRKNLAKMPKFESYTEEQIKQIRQKAKQFLPTRLEFLAQKHGFKYGKVSLRNQKTRWGSCSGDNGISLNIALVLLKPHLIDYVILHELTHTIVKSHSPEFWAELAKTCPSFKANKKELRTHNPYLK